MTQKSKSSTESQREPELQDISTRKLRTRDKIFLFAAFIVMLIVFPYVYYTGRVYFYIQENATKAGPGFILRP